MNGNSRKTLKHFFEMFPETKRVLNPDLSHPGDRKRMVQFADSLIMNGDTFDIDDIRSVCEEVGGDQYSSLVSSPLFEGEFSSIIFSEIDYIKYIIDTDRSIMSIDGGTI